MWRAIVAIMLLAPSLAFGGQIPLLPSLQYQLPITAPDFSNLINQINNNFVQTQGGTISGVLGAMGAFGTSGTSLSGLSGSTIVDGLVVAGGSLGSGNVQLAAAGADTNINITLSPKGTGVLAFTNSASFVPAAGLVACPGYVAAGLNPPGLSPVVTGYWVFQDLWGKTHRVPTC